MNVLVIDNYDSFTYNLVQFLGELGCELDVVRNDVTTVEALLELEPVKRGGYGGAIGWLGYSGDLDTCIHIRTVVMKDGRAHVQAGGGTVADAQPAWEWNESVNKAKAVFRAVEMACEQPDWS